MQRKSLTHLNDCPPEKFTIYAYRSCGHSAAVDRKKGGNAEIETLASRLPRSKCGGREISISIVYTGAREFHHSWAAGREVRRDLLLWQAGRISAHLLHGLRLSESAHPVANGSGGITQPSSQEVVEPRFGSLRPAAVTGPRTTAWQRRSFISATATISLRVSSTPRCSFRSVRRRPRPMPCLHAYHSPAPNTFHPVVSMPTSRVLGLAAEGGPADSTALGELRLL